MAVEPDAEDLAELLEVGSWCGTCCPPDCLRPSLSIEYTSTEYDCERKGFSGWLSAGHPTVTSGSSGHTAVKYYTGRNPTTCFYTRSTYAPNGCTSTATNESLSEAAVGVCPSASVFTGSLSLADVPIDQEECFTEDGPNVGTPPGAVSITLIQHIRSGFHGYTFSRFSRTVVYKLQLTWPGWWVGTTDKAYRYTVIVAGVVRDVDGVLVSADEIKETFTFPKGTIGGDTLVGVTRELVVPDATEETTTASSWTEESYTMAIELSDSADPKEMPGIRFGVGGPCVPPSEEEVP
jgi:hypothetical protein